MVAPTCVYSGYAVLYIDACITCMFVCYLGLNGGSAQYYTFALINFPPSPIIQLGSVLFYYYYSWETRPVD